MLCSRGLFDSDGIKLSGEVSKLPSSIRNSCCCSSAVHYFPSLRDGSAQWQCQHLYLWFSWQRNNGLVYAVHSWLLTHCGRVGLVSALTFWSLNLSSWATPGCLHDNGASQRNSDFATNRFDRELVAMLVQGGPISRKLKNEENVCLK